MRIRDYMLTDIPVLACTMEIVPAYKLLSGKRGDFALVADPARRHTLGIVEKKTLSMILSHEHDPEHPSDKTGRRLKLSLGLMMQQHPYHIHPEAFVEEGIAVLRLSQGDPVLVKDGARVLGIWAQESILRAMEASLGAASMEAARIELVTGKSAGLLEAITSLLHKHHILVLAMTSLYEEGAPTRKILLRIRGKRVKGFLDALEQIPCHVSNVTREFFEAPRQSRRTDWAPLPACA